MRPLATLVHVTISCLLASSTQAQTCLDNLNSDAPYSELVSCIKSDLTKQIAAELATNHLDKIAGPQGEPGKDGFSLNELDQHLRENYSSVLTDEGVVLSVSYSSGNGPNDNLDDGRIVSRELRFFKKEASSKIRILYSDNMRVYGQNKACRWHLKIDGTDCEDGSLFTDRHDGSSSNVHSTSTAVGYCSNLQSGWHTIHVWVSSVPHPDGNYAGADCYTGWDHASWIIEATELRNMEEH